MTTLEAPRISAQARRDIAQALDATQARMLVDYYYSIQDYRIQATGQARSIAQAADDGVLNLFEQIGGDMTAIENEIKKALGAYAEAHTAGRWALSIHGIGPVIAAGLLAHIDITRAPTVGHIWRFAGLDPTVKWHGTKGVRELVDAAIETHDDPRDVIDWLSRALHMSQTALYGKAGYEIPTREDAFDKLIAGGLNREHVAAAFADRPIELSAALGNLAGQHGHAPYEVLFPANDKGRVFDKTAFTKALGRRPWNASLKTLCWKIGDSFVKQRGSDKDIYGHIYAERKDIEVERNMTGVNAVTAKETLEAKKFRDSDTKKAYESGMLPAGRIDLRARRYATKLFLSHLHHVLYESHYNAPPPKPYVLTRDEHVHFLAPPNWPMAEG